VKEARNQSKIFNRKSISCKTTHRQSYHLQAVLTAVKRWKANTRSEKVNNLRLQRKKRTDPTAKNKSKRLAQLHANAEASKLTAQMTRTYNFNDRAGQYIGRYLFGHISPAAAAREMFKPSTDSASILVPSRKIFSFGLEVILGGRHKCFFLTFLWPTLPGPGRQSNGPTFWPKFLCKLGYPTSFSRPWLAF